MRKVIMIGQEPREESKGIEFTHYLSGKEGWVEANSQPEDADKIVYLGKCCIDGDMFTAYFSKSICIYKGKLNDGTY